MVDWNKDGWRVERAPFVKVYLNEKRGVAMMFFWTHARIAFLSKEDTKKFSKMMDAPNHQFMDAFILERSDMRVD